jgi:hypothetical protein
MDDGHYTYTLTAPYGQVYTPAFQPYLTPAEMLAYGVFEGKYMCDCTREFPVEWYKKARLSPKEPNIECNFFKIKSRQSLSTWRKNGWIPVAPNDPDNRGWFQWYCRYYLGRRIPNVDQIQIKRWRSFRRHMAQVVKNCSSDRMVVCRPKQRQALLQWAYNAFYPFEKPRLS